MKLVPILTVAAVASVAVADPPQPSALVVLHQSSSGALEMVGNAKVEIPTRAVYVNSSHNQAVSTTGTAILDAPFLYVVGGARFNGQSHCTGQVIRSMAPYQDPCAGTIWPHPASLSDRGGSSINGGNVTLEPGYYSGGVSISGNASVTLSPGLYVFAGNGFNVSSGRVNGEGVCLMIMSGSFDVAGNSQLQLSPPADGPQAGLTLAQYPTNTSGANLRGGSDTMVTGTLYFPNNLLTMVGNSTVEGQGPLMGDIVVANKISLRGTAVIRIGRESAPALELPVMAVYD